MNPENEEDKQDRLRLRGLLKRVHQFLTRVDRSMTSSTSRLADGVKNSLATLWLDADAKLTGVESSLDIGNPLWRRTALERAGLTGLPLGAKASLLEHLLDEKRFIAVLKLLASLCGSLARAFHVMSAVKEFIDAVLCARDWLPNDPEITTLGDLR